MLRFKSIGSRLTLIHALSSIAARWHLGRGPGVAVQEKRGEEGRSKAFQTRNESRASSKTDEDVLAVAENKEGRRTKGSKNHSVASATPTKPANAEQK